MADLPRKNPPGREGAGEPSFAEDDELPPTQRRDLGPASLQRNNGEPGSAASSLGRSAATTAPSESTPDTARAAPIPARPPAGTGAFGRAVDARLNLGSMRPSRAPGSETPQATPPSAHTASTASAAQRFRQGLPRAPNSVPPTGSMRSPSLTLRRPSLRVDLEAKATTQRTLSGTMRLEPSGSAEPNLWLPDDDPRTIRVKGINFLTCLDAVQKLYGLSARTRIEREAPGELGDALRFGGIVIGGWYKASWYRAFWRVVVEILNIDAAGTKRIGHKAAGIGVNVAYRTLSRLSTPAMLLSMSARAFGYFFDKGKLEVQQPESSRLTAHWTHCYGFDTNIWNEVAGGALYFIEATGAKNVDFSILSGGGSSDWMIASASYK